MPEYKDHTNAMILIGAVLFMLGLGMLNPQLDEWMSTEAALCITGAITFFLIFLMWCAVHLGEIAKELHHIRRLLEESKP